MVHDVETKFEALRMATLIMCQSATAGKQEETPTPVEVLEEAKRLYEWLKE